jgi:hypothetical protein
MLKFLTMTFMTPTLTAALRTSAISGATSRDAKMWMEVHTSWREAT